MRKVLIITVILSILISTSQPAAALSKMGGYRDKSIFGVRQNSFTGNRLFGQPGLGLNSNVFNAQSSNTKSGNKSGSQSLSDSQKQQWNQIQQQYIEQKYQKRTTGSSQGYRPDGFVPF